MSATLRAPSRRDLLAGATAALVTGAATTAADGAEPPILAPSPDAELIGLCAAFDVLTREFFGLFSGPGRIEDDELRDVAIDRIHAQQEPLASRIWATRAGTSEGTRAKTRSLALWAPDLMQPENPYWDDKFIASILADAAVRTGE